MPTWGVVFRTTSKTNQGSDTVIAAAGYVGEELPEPGDEIDVGGATAIVDSILEHEQTRESYIVATRSGEGTSGAQTLASRTFELDESELDEMRSPRQE